MLNQKQIQKIIDLGDQHINTSQTTPIRKDAFDLTDAQKIDIIANKFQDIMDTLGLDLNDDSLAGTPYRVAKMYIEEVFSGLNPNNKPKITLFENKYNYNQMLIEKNITLQSICEHHFVPIIGVAHVGYISNGKVIGLSKINRIVQYFSKRPQVQERLTIEIANCLCESLETDDVCVVIDAKHYCVCMRGVQDIQSSTITSEYRGKFKEEGKRKEFLQYLKLND